MKKVLITGGTGFVGSTVLRRLVRDGTYDICAMRRESSSMDLVDDLASDIDWIRADMTDSESLLDACQGIDAIIHCAAHIGSDRQRLQDINVHGTAYLVNAALAQSVQRMVYIGSIVALGGERGRPLTESDYWPDAPIPVTYGYSKYLAEQEVWRGSAEGLEAAVVLPAYIMGPYQWNSGADMIQAICSGVRYYPTGRTGVVTVDDVARMAIQLLEHPLSEGSRYICSAQDIELSALMERVDHHLGQSVKRKPLTLNRWKEWGLRVVQLMGGFRDVDIELARFSQLSISYDHQRSVDELGFEYSDIDDTIRDAVDLFLKEERNA